MLAENVPQIKDNSDFPTSSIYTEQDFKIRHDRFFSLRNQVIIAAGKSSLFVYATTEAGPIGIYAVAALEWVHMQKRN